MDLYLHLHCTVPSNRVISSPFSHKIFFSQNNVKVPHIFFLVGNSLKKIALDVSMVIFALG
jgi:hypothetical protein